MGGNFTVTTYTPNGTRLLLNNVDTPVSVSANSFFDLEINKSAAGDVVNSTGAWTVTNSLTLTQGTWNAGAFTHLIAGAWNSTGVNFTFNSNTSTIQLTSANPNISTKGLVIDPFYNLTTNNGGTLQTAVLVSNNLDITGTLSTNNLALTVTHNLTGAGTLAGLGGSAAGADHGGGQLHGHHLHPQRHQLLLNNVDTPVSVSANTFFDLEINKSAAGDVVNSTGAWTVTNSLTLTQGTWNAGAFTHLIAGAWNSTGVNFTFNSNTSTIQLTSANPNISTKGLVIDPFYNLTTNNGGTLQTSVRAANNLGITAGTLSLNNFPLTVGVNLTGAGLAAAGAEAINVGGNWNITTFTQTTSTVTFTGASGAGPFTVTSNAQSFYDVVLNAAGKSYQQSGAASVSNTLDLTAGTWNTNNANLTVTHNLTGAAPWPVLSERRRS